MDIGCVTKWVVLSIDKYSHHTYPMGDNCLSMILTPHAGKSIFNQHDNAIKLTVIASLETISPTIYEWKYMLLLLEKKNHIMWQFCPCHDSSAVMMCTKLSHDLIIRIKISTKRTFTRWAHKLLVEWFPGVKQSHREPTTSSFRFIGSCFPSLEMLPWTGIY